MALATYTELEAAINRYLRRSDRETQIQDWIVLVESEAERELDLRSQQQRTTGTLAAGSAVLETPVGILYPQQLVFASQPPINVSTVVLPAGEETAFTAAGQATPKQASVWGVTSDYKTQIRVWPVPSGDVAYTLYYTTGIVPLTASAPTNYLLSVASDLYLYGCLVHGKMYDQDTDGAAFWQPFYAKALASVKKIEARARARVGRLRVRPQFATP